METLTRDQVASLVREQLERIRDSTVREVLGSFIAEPVRRLLDWDYGPPGQRFPCWIVASDPATDSALALL
jgi:hypothetical protein